MRRLSIQLTTLLALLPALVFGCAKSYSESPDSAYDARDYYAERSDERSDEPSDERSYDSPDGDSFADAEAPGHAYAEERGGPAPAPSAAPVEAGAGGSAAARSSAAPAKAVAGKRAERSRVAKDSSPAEPSPAKIARERRDQQIQSGTLTAGSFDDNLNPWVFDKFISQVRAQPSLANLAAAFVGPRTIVRVQDPQGRPLANAKVTIDGKQLMTRSDGRVVWVSAWDSGSQGQGKATVEHGNARQTVSIKDQVEQIVTLAQTQATLPTQLDIALVIDATGSMGDELEYLKVEIRDIAGAINRHFPNVDQRFALVVYRDVGDQYVTRVFDFTSDLSKFQRDLSAQSAAGGGDYPEAMDAAFAATSELSWRKGDTARVAFLVADAPPHTNKISATLTAVDGLRSKGVAIYPVASSGVAGEAEFVMRAIALLTGAQYLFLTDDSGVGDAHAEPHIPCYTVEQLAPLMVRAIRSELAGRRVEAEPQFSIRTVGRGQAGVCEKPRSAATIAK